MVSYLTVNLVVASVTYAICLLLPIFLETPTRRSDGGWRNALGLPNGGRTSEVDDQQRTRLSVPLLGITMHGLRTSGERVEAAQRARFWLEAMHGCASSDLCGPAKYMTAGDVLVRAVKQLATEYGAPPRSAVLSSVWNGAFSARLLHAAGSVDTIAVGSTTACAAFVSEASSDLQANTRGDNSNALQCLDGRAVHPLVADCRGPAHCVFDDSALTTASGSVPGVPLFAVEHRAPRVILIDLEPSSVSLTVFALVQALAWLRTDDGRHSVVACVWRVDGSGRPTDAGDPHLMSGVGGVVDKLQAFNASISFAMLHGDCVGADTGTQLRPLSARVIASFASPILKPKACFMVFRNTAEEAIRPLAAIVNAENLPRLGMPFLGQRFHRADRAPSTRGVGMDVNPPTTWGATILNGAFLMVAVAVGVALCYGIGKNWFGKRRRSTVAPLQHVV